MLPRHRRLSGLILVLLGVGLASFFVLKSFQENLLYYFTPIQVQAGEAPIDREFRMGGLVLPGSFKREEGSLSVEFVLTEDVLPNRVLLQAHSRLQPHVIESLFVLFRHHLADAGR